MSDNKKYAVFTMDVEDFADTGCLAKRGLFPSDDMFDGMEKYVELLERHGIRATMFTLASSAKKIGDKLVEYNKRGHRIALHGFDHTSLERLSDEEFRERTIEAKEYLEGLIGEKVQGFRAPFFSMDNSKMNILRELGFKYDSSSHDFTQNYLNGELRLDGYKKILSGAFSKKDFFEFSLSCENILGCSYPVSGGGYVRLCLWPIVKGGIKKYIAKNDYYVFYLHPFELSAHRAKGLTGIPANERFYLNCGISSYAKKIEYIIGMLKSEGYSFVTFDELCEIMEKDKDKDKVLSLS